MHTDPSGRDPWWLDPSDTSYNPECAYSTISIYEDLKCKDLDRRYCEWLGGCDYEPSDPLFDSMGEAACFAASMTEGPGTAIDTYEAVTGKECGTGRTLSWWERAIAAGCVIVPGVGGYAVRKGIGWLRKTDDVVDSVRDYERGGRVNIDDINRESYTPSISNQKQKDSNECVLASCSIATGVNYDTLRKILDFENLGKHGYHLRNTVQPLRNAGFDAFYAEGAEMSVENLRIVTASKPAIVSVTAAGQYNRQISHAVVVEKIDDTHVYILDPSPTYYNPVTGEYEPEAYRITIDTFNQTWRENKTVYFK